MFGKLRKTTVGRRAKRVSADFYLNKIIADQPHLARVRDISTQGMYVYKILEPTITPENNQVGLEFQLPESDHIIWAVGEIVRDEPAVARKNTKLVNGVAIRFLRIDEPDRRAIAAYGAKNLATHAA